MQTFLPSPCFIESAAILDRARLGKQRIEAKQILAVLEGRTSAWANHPAVRMWQGHEAALCLYGQAIVDEWVRRGYRNSISFPKTSGPMPEWLGTGAFHASHRSNLLRKDPVYYGHFGWPEPPTLEYVWPT